MGSRWKRSRLNKPPTAPPLGLSPSLGRLRRPSLGTGGNPPPPVPFVFANGSTITFTRKEPMYDPCMDGVDHINIYSKSRTALGRFLSNFAYTPFSCEDGKFASVEGYWYWLSTHDDRLRTLSGFAAKQLGRSLERSHVHPVEFERKIRRAIRAKLEANQHMLDELCESTLPLTHYYVYGGKVVTASQSSQFILDYLDWVRRTA